MWAACCGQRMSRAVAALFQRADMFGLNHVLAVQNQKRSTSPVVRMRKGNPAKRPLFFLHGDYLGDGLYCRSLVKSLSAELPVFVIHPNGVVDGQPRETIVEIAEHHRQHLQRIQPQGPYRVGGYCNAAVEAYELAQRLHASGQQVEALATEAEIHNLSGNHETLITHHASAIAEVIEQLKR